MTAGQAVIIGAGLGGLSCGVLLAEAGWRVTLLEQFRKPGGYMARFRRGGAVFDTGFHFVGSLGPGEASRPYFEDLGILERVKLIRFPSDRFFRYLIPGSSPLELPNGLDAAFDVLNTRFPGNTAGLDSFKSQVRETMATFPWFNLEPVPSEQVHRHMRTPLKTMVDQATEDAGLRRVLMLMSWGTSLRPEVCPFALAAILNGSMIAGAWRISGGGEALTKALVDRFLELGGILECSAEVTGFKINGLRAESVQTSDGRQFEGDLFIATPHPKTILEIAGPEAFRPTFREMVQDFEDAPGSFCVFLETDRSPDSLCRTNNFLLGESWEDTIYLLSPSAVEGADKGHTLHALTWMDFDKVSAWAESKPGSRPPAYLEFKARRTERILSRVKACCPEIREGIRYVEASTPLTNQYYTRSHGGAAMGVSQGVHQQGARRMRPRNKLRNLFFAGQSVGTPGIIGTLITSYMLCDQILGEGVLWNRLRKRAGKAP